MTHPTKTSFENLLNKIPDSKPETLTDLVSDKAQSLKSTLKEILEDINLRKNINYRLLKKINKTICQENTALMALEKQEGQYHFDIEIRKVKRKFEDSVLDLEKEKRAEYLECWRDLVDIKRYLMVAFREYWDLAKRREMLGER